MKKPTDYRSDEYPMKASLCADSEGLGAWGNKNGDISDGGVMSG
jgi:hypothetical protein